MSKSLPQCPLTPYVFPLQPPPELSMPGEIPPEPVRNANRSNPAIKHFICMAESKHDTHRMQICSLLEIIIARYHRSNILGQLDIEEHGLSS